MGAAAKVLSLKLSKDDKDLSLTWKILLQIIVLIKPYITSNELMTLIVLKVTREPNLKKSN